MLRILSKINRLSFSTLVLGEHNGKTVYPNTLKLINTVREFDEKVSNR
jgi:hypothetical protein